MLFMQSDIILLADEFAFFNKKKLKTDLRLIHKILFHYLDTLGLVDWSLYEQNQKRHKTKTATCWMSGILEGNCRVMVARYVRSVNNTQADLRGCAVSPYFFPKIFYTDEDAVLEKIAIQKMMLILDNLLTMIGIRETLCRSERRFSHSVWGGEESKPKTNGFMHICEREIRPILHKYGFTCDWSAEGKHFVHC